MSELVIKTRHNFHVRPERYLIVLCDFDYSLFHDATTNSKSLNNEIFNKNNKFTIFLRSNFDKR